MAEFEIKILKDPINLSELKILASHGFGQLVKAVVDVENGTLALGGELHVDIESTLIQKTGAFRNNTWGINLYPEKTGEEFIEFDSMINLKPAYGNRTRNVDDLKIQQKIREIVEKWIIT